MGSATAKKYKAGSVILETFKDVGAGSSQISLTHTLGRIPDIVIITPKTQYFVYESQARTASLVYLTGTTGTSTCDVTLGIFEDYGSITETTT